MLSKLRAILGGKRETRPMKTCPACKGEKISVCVHCGGSGLLSIPNRTIPCHHCSGSGKGTCGACSGTGQVPA